MKQNQAQQVVQDSQISHESKQHPALLPVNSQYPKYHLKKSEQNPQNLQINALGSPKKSIAWTEAQKNEEKSPSNLQNKYKIIQQEKMRIKTQQQSCIEDIMSVNSGLAKQNMSLKQKVIKLQNGCKQATESKEKSQLQLVKFKHSYEDLINDYNLLLQKQAKQQELTVRLQNLQAKFGSTLQKNKQLQAHMAHMKEMDKYFDKQQQQSHQHSRPKIPHDISSIKESKINQPRIYHRQQLQASQKEFEQLKRIIEEFLLQVQRNQAPNNVQSSKQKTEISTIVQYLAKVILKLAHIKCQRLKQNNIIEQIKKGIHPSMLLSPENQSLSENSR